MNVGQRVLDVLDVQCVGFSGVDLSSFLIRTNACLSRLAVHSTPLQL